MGGCSDDDSTQLTSEGTRAGECSDGADNDGDGLFDCDDDDCAADAACMPEADCDDGEDNDCSGAIDDNPIDGTDFFVDADAEPGWLPTGIGALPTQL